MSNISVSTICNSAFALNCIFKPDFVEAFATIEKCCTNTNEHVMNKHVISAFKNQINALRVSATKFCDSNNLSFESNAILDSNDLDFM